MFFARRPVSSGPERVEELLFIFPGLALAQHGQGRLGAQGIIAGRNPLPQRQAHSTHEAVIPSQFAAWIPDNVQGGVSETWDKLMDHFVRMLADNEPCLNDVHSAFQTSAACFAAVESAKLGKTVLTGER